MDKKKSLAAAAGAAAGWAAWRGVDLALIGGSVATATGAVAFAGYMTLRGDHEPYINGMDRLAIFAQPSHPHRVDANGKPVDMNPTGAIPPDQKMQVNGLQLVGAQPRLAWLRDGNHIFAVHPGDEIVRLGKVVKIEPRDGRWSLIGADDKPLIVSALPDLMPSAGGKFDKKMIFGDGD